MQSKSSSLRALQQRGGSRNRALSLIAGRPRRSSLAGWDLGWTEGRCQISSRAWASRPLQAVESWRRTTWNSGTAMTKIRVVERGSEHGGTYLLSRVEACRQTCKMFGTEFEVAERAEKRQTRVLETHNTADMRAGAATSSRLRVRVMRSMPSPAVGYDRFRPVKALTVRGR